MQECEDLNPHHHHHRPKIVVHRCNNRPHTLTCESSFCDYRCSRRQRVFACHAGSSSTSNPGDQRYGGRCSLAQPRLTEREFSDERTILLVRVPEFNRVALHHGGVWVWRAEAVEVVVVLVAVMVAVGLKG